MTVNPGHEAISTAKPPHEEIRIRNGALEAAVRPDVGGSLAGFWYAATGQATRAVLRAAPEDARSPLQMASFPLVPFCNRIADGRFQWQGREVRLSPNHPGDEFPLHGYGWYGQWSVAAVEPAAVELEWDDVGGEWPWPYVARQRYGLTRDALVVTLSVQNRGVTPMPTGLGHHPYFPRTAGTLVRAHLPTLWQPDARLIPTGPTRNPLADAFERGCAIAGVRLDAGYTGWDGRAVIEQPADGLRAELLGRADDAFHLYVPDAPLFCAEAVTNQPNAINDPRAVARMVALPPGETLHYTMRIRVAPLSS